MPVNAFLIFLATAVLTISAISLPNTISPRSDFNSCVTASQVTSLTNITGSDYANATLSYNRRFHYLPAAIAYPTSAAQVASIVKCAATFKLNVVARSGGHSYGAYGLGGRDGSVVVDLSKMKTLSVDPATGYAVSGTGNLLGELAQGLWANGQRALPHGMCPYVGTGGHASFGGFGLFSRYAGLLLDRIVSAEVVTANGTILTASNTSYPDLFWALRGAAPSYGIVTSWTFATLPAPPVLINYNIDFPDIQLSNPQAVQILGIFQNFAASQPRKELSMVCSLNADSGSISLSFGGTYYGSAEDFQAVIQPYMGSLWGLVAPRLTTTPTNWYDGLVISSGPLSTTNMEQPNTFYAKSIMNAFPISEASVTNWVNWIMANNAWSNLRWWVLIDMYGGTVSEVPTNATAYANRNAILTWQFYGSTTTPDGFPPSGIAFMNGLVGSLQANPTQAYPNYVDPNLSPQEWQEMYFGSNFARLVDLKRVWDPMGVFTFPQSIPLE